VLKYSVARLEGSSDSSTLEQRSLPGTSSLLGWQHHMVMDAVLNPRTVHCRNGLDGLSPTLRHPTRNVRLLPKMLSKDFIPEHGRKRMDAGSITFGEEKGWITARLRSREKAYDRSR
jgi:hypothetical protein